MAISRLALRFKIGLGPNMAHSKPSPLLWLTMDLGQGLFNPVDPIGNIAKLEPWLAKPKHGLSSAQSTANTTMKTHGWYQCNI
ncbi:hypothetical protein AMTR_s00005p00083890 [Amborella trichopoda]|uniref:Uncharacterized protein n=1 Tax=Amborella trichopoda TaxID=13333 RepID=W1PGC6_AMBTC|nr:hypothetical protein AMTR_s00005p00083890 [Amborella trichopoda]